mmetsp:Transcript_10248/g.16781  ORF Transcript_10248/g.16781 Transcript_10248/m.16781 type:complete len:115 (-) Transcript_10248:703-1047(-)
MANTCTYARFGCRATANLSLGRPRALRPQARAFGLAAAAAAASAGPQMLQSRLIGRKRLEHEDDGVRACGPTRPAIPDKAHKAASSDGSPNQDEKNPRSLQPTSRRPALRCRRR